jgi:saposin
VIRPRSPQQSASSSCRLCTILAEQLEPMALAGHNAFDSVSRAGQICQILDPTAHPACAQIVSLHGRTLFKLIQSGLPLSKACAATRLCPTTPTSSARRPHRAALPPNAKGCDVCMQFAEYVKVLMWENITGPDFYNHLTVFCETFPYPDSALCDALETIYLAEIEKEVQAGTESFDICVNIGFCDGCAKKRSDVYDCDFCQNLILWLEAQAQHFAEPYVLDALIDLCVTLPSPLSAFCVAYVDQTIDAWIQWIEDQVPGYQICELVGFCPDPTEKKVNVLKFARPGDSVLCELCKGIVDAIAQMLVDQKVEEEIEDYLQGWCSEIGGAIGNLCKSIVEQYTPLICELLEEGLEELDICQKIGLCDNRNAKSAPPKVRRGRLA